MINTSSNFKYLFIVSFILSGCSLAPHYQPTPMSVPEQFKESDSASQETLWKLAQPNDTAPKGEWWRIFDDLQLNDLQQQAISSNQNIRATLANIKASRALVQSARAENAPQLDVQFGPTRTKASPASLGLSAGSKTSAQTLWRAQSNISYELDLFGRVASHVNAANADLEQQQANYFAMLLALQADVAQHYFLIRQLDSEQLIYEQMIKLLTSSRDLIQSRFKHGAVSELDVFRAQTELSIAETNALSIQRHRATLEHALALLLGKAPAEFSLAVQPLSHQKVHVPSGLPSSLLERRPDIAAAERAMAASNARIGIARAAFFPRLSLTSSFGYESSQLHHLADWSSRTFLLGPAAGAMLALPIFDGGKRKASVKYAEANYEESIALYRQTVLNAFREVENRLSDQRILDQQIKTQAIALTSAQKANQISHSRFREGMISYLDVIDTDRNTLQQELLSAQLYGQRMTISVDLIRALGGGWQSQNQITLAH